MSSEMDIDSPTLVWRGHPFLCDHCRIPEQSLPAGLLVCSQCKVARYCSAVCQKRDWKGDHRAVCPRLVEDRAQTAKWHRKYSERAPTTTALLSESDKACEWVLHNVANIFAIACAALKNDIEYARRHDVHISLTQMEEHKNDAREYFVDEVAFNTKEFTKQTMATHIFEGGERNVDPNAPNIVATIHVQHPRDSLQVFHISAAVLAAMRLPRDIALDRFVAYFGRGLTHLGASVGTAGGLAGEAYKRIMQQYRPNGYEFGIVDAAGHCRPFMSFDRKGNPLPAAVLKYLDEQRNDPHARGHTSPRMLEEDHPMTKIVRAAYS